MSLFPCIVTTVKSFQNKVVGRKPKWNNFKLHSNPTTPAQWNPFFFATHEAGILSCTILFFQSHSLSLPSSPHNALDSVLGIEKEDDKAPALKYIPYVRKTDSAVEYSQVKRKVRRFFQRTLYKWPISTGKDAHCPQPLRKCKSKARWNTTSHSWE